MTASAEERPRDRTAAAVWLARVGPFALHLAQGGLPAVVGLAVSARVVRSHGPELWGAFVAALLVPQFAMHLIAFGHRDPLLRAMTGAPQQARTLWAHNVWTRHIFIGVAASILAAMALALGPTPMAWRPLALWMLVRPFTQSYEVVVVYERAFGRALAVEGVAGAVWLAATLHLQAAAPALQLEALLWSYAGVEVLRGLGYRAALAGWRLGWPRLSPAPVAALREALPFVLLGATGLVGSRVDLWVIAALSPSAEVARYQLTLGALLWLQALAGFAMGPLAGRFYGGSAAELTRLLRGFALLGALVGVAGAAATGWLVREVYRLPFEAPLAAWGALHVAQIFVQAPAIAILYRRRDERWVAAGGVAGVLASLVGCLVVVSRHGAVGALAVNALVGTTLALVYMGRGRLKLPEVESSQHR